MENKDTIDLLNSEGPLLIATKIYRTEHNGHGFISQYVYKINDRYNKILAFFTADEIYEFTRGKRMLTDSKGKILDYGKEPGSMKPDLKELDEFIGIDTAGKTY